MDDDVISDSFVIVHSLMNEWLAGLSRNVNVDHSLLHSHWKLNTTAPIRTINTYIHSYESSSSMAAVAMTANELWANN